MFIVPHVHLKCVWKPVWSLIYRTFPFCKAANIEGVGETDWPSVELN